MPLNRPSENGREPPWPPWFPSDTWASLPEGWWGPWGYCTPCCSWLGAVLILLVGLAVVLAAMIFGRV